MATVDILSHKKGDILEKIEVEQGTFQWETLRNTAIGSSDAPSIMGDSPYTTKLELWLKKVNMETPEDNFIFARGHRLEAKAREIYNKTYNCLMVPGVYRSDENPFMIASLDGYDSNSGIIWEGKYTGAEKYEWVIKNRKPLPEHLAQLQHQMAATGAVFNDYMIYTIDKEENIDKTFVLRVERDETYIEDLIKEESEFYLSMIHGIKPPPSEKDSVEVESKKMQKVLDHYRRIYKQSKELDKVKKELKDEITEMIIHPKMHFENITVSSGKSGAVIRFKKQKS